MKTTTESRDRVRRTGVFARRAAVGAVAVVLLAAGCADDAGDNTSADGPGVVQDDTVETAEVDEAAPQPDAPPDEVPAVSPAVALGDALASLGTSYEFTSEITTATGDRILVDGYRLDDGVRYELEAGDAIVEVILVGDASWVLQDGTSEWIESGQSESGDPLASLSEPVEIATDPSSPDGLRATYSAEALGIEGAGTVEVVITIDDGSVSFASTTDSISLVTTLRQATGLSEIVPPV